MFTCNNSRRNFIMSAKIKNNAFAMNRNIFANNVNNNNNNNNNNNANYEISVE